MATPMPPMPPMGPPSSPDTPPMDMPPPMGPMPAMDMPPMQMAFFWGHRAQVLFTNWPGYHRSGAGMYVTCLLVVAALAALVEALSAASSGLSRRRRRSRNSGGAPEAMLLTGVHAAKMGLAYLVMLAVMSFNAGVFLAVVAGHAAGFMLMRSGILGGRSNNSRDEVPTNGGVLPPSGESEPKP